MQDGTDTGQSASRTRLALSAPGSIILISLIAEMLVMIGFLLAVLPLFVSNSRLTRFRAFLLFGAYPACVLLLYGVI